MNTKRHMIVSGLLLAMLIVLPGRGVLAASTSLDTFVKKVQKYGLGPAGPKALCVCQDGSANHGLAGALGAAAVSPANDDNRVRVICYIEYFHDDGGYFGSDACQTWVPLAK